MCWLSKLFSGTIERPSPSDIVPKDNITVVDWEDTTQIVIDYEKPLNIPFTIRPKILNIMGIPDTNSMDGLMDYGHNPLYIEPANEANHQIMVDWLALEFLTSKGMLANDCVYRVMVDSNDDPRDFTKPSLIYAIHRIYKVGADAIGRYFEFKGINNPTKDPFKARDHNLLFLNTGIIF